MDIRLFPCDIVCEDELAWFSHRLGRQIRAKGNARELCVLAPRPLVSVPDGESLNLKADDPRADKHVIPVVLDDESKMIIEVRHAWFGSRELLGANEAESETVQSCLSVRAGCLPRVLGALEGTCAGCVQVVLGCNQEGCAHL